MDSPPYPTITRAPHFYPDYLLVARIKFDQPEIGDLRDRAIDYRAVIVTAAIEVIVKLP